MQAQQNASTNPTQQRFILITAHAFIGKGKSTSIEI